MSDTPTFPSLDARSLDGTRLQLPQDFADGPVIAVVAFERRQQSDVDTWLAALLEHERDIPGLRVYEIPCISGRWSLARPFIDGGMTAGIPDPEARARTLTTYTDVGRVVRALGLTGTDEIAVVLTGRDGAISWLATGPFDTARAAELSAALT